MIPPLAPVCALRTRVRALLESRGIRFFEETEYDTPGPVQFAVVELDGGSQFMVQDHYQRPEYRIVVSGQVRAVGPKVLCHEFASALGLAETDILWTAEGWQS